MVSRKRILGIEGGGTKTTWCLVENNKILTQGTAGPGNISLLTDEQLKKLFHQIRRTLPCPPDAVGAGMAGAMNPSDFKRLEKQLRTVFPKANPVIGREDTYSGFYAAHPNGNGILVIAGTGSNVMGRNHNQWIKAGGWGHIAGDGGSSWDIARLGIRATYHYYDRTGKTDILGQEILQATGENTLEDCISWVMSRSNDKKEIASLSRIVFRAANKGSVTARRLIRVSCETLVERTLIVIQRLKFKKPSIALIGGLFENEPGYKKLFETLLRQKREVKNIFVCKTPGAVGAVRMASDSLLLTEKGNVQKAIPLLQSPTEILPSHPLNETNSIPKLVEHFLQHDRKIAKAVAQAKKSIIYSLTLLEKIFQRGGRLFYIGAGTSGRLGALDAAEIPPTFGTDPELVQAIIAGGSTALLHAIEGAEDDIQSAEQSVKQRGISNRDMVIGISASGRTPFVLSALKMAKKMGACTALITCNPHFSLIPNEFKPKVTIVLNTGPEIIAGSTRLGAGTATKMVLNMLSSIAMIRLKKVYKGWMTNLRPTNSKLKQRAVQIVSQLASLDSKKAQLQLEQANWNVRKVLTQFLKVT